MIRHEFDFAVEFAFRHCCCAKTEAASSAAFKVNMLRVPARCAIVVLCVLTRCFFGKTPWVRFRPRVLIWSQMNALFEALRLLLILFHHPSFQEGSGRCKALSWWVWRKTASEAAEKAFWPKNFFTFLLLSKCLHNEHIERVTPLKSYPG